MSRHATRAPCAIALVLLALAACSPKGGQDDAKPATSPAMAAVVQKDERTCNNDPHPDEEDTLPRCGGMATAVAPLAYRFVGGSGDPIDQVVCDISETFVLDGKLFGVEFSGGVDGTWKFVRTPNIPGLSWKAGGRYHIEFPDGPAKPGTMTTEGGGTTTAGSQSRDTAGAEHFTLTPTEACTQ
ncbi:hypothetical protein [Thermomonas sp. HDW16]|uniref:hypothetical protein n=1 Tax=Thermomonas sp. HDW16 TaxID=2714945 RepID=UPI00140C3073|nr:hypothetical protein [Thermomonas sp. HDW16]QIL19367.1 hypothetical protein G7079_00675 [Thermomonas sp. HDW16]